jgi:hypothetical protein
MAGGWQDLADTMNDQFENHLSTLVNEFKAKHGPNGSGGGGKKPYKFGHFVHKNPNAGLSDRAHDRFLMDSGTRHWGGDKAGNPRGTSPDLKNIEDVVKFSLTDTRPKKIKFTVKTDLNATYAKASVKAKIGATTVDITKGEDDPNLTTLVDSFEVTITCPPGV